MNIDISFDYIRGLVDGEGCFTFCRSGGSRYRDKVPTFSLGMTERDFQLLTIIRDKLGLRNKVYLYGPRKRKDGYKRDGMAILIVRDFGQIKNIIIPLFYKKLIGYKAKQFEEWIENMGSDPDVPEIYQFMKKLYHSGFYEKVHKFD